MQELAHKTAVVTGAASGLGLAMARRFARAGMNLVLADVEQAALIRAADEIAALGVQALPVRTDVAQAESVEALAEAAQARFGALHLVCNNAGVGGLRRRIWEADLRDWQWVLGVNLWGVIHGVKSFVPRMLAQDCDCHMVNTASVAGLLSTPAMAVYNVSKHGVVTLTETLHHDLAEIGARLKVSLLLPAWVDTEIWNSGRNRPESLRVAEAEAGDRARGLAMRELLKKGRLGADDVAAMVLDAVLNERFYVLTHPRISTAVEARLQDILQGRDPRSADRPTPRPS
jgi:NAD(P)-dependent dehydrogenase (short-subunit alcohol dehydrogenase family)